MLVALEAKSPDQSLNHKHSKAFMTASLIRQLDHRCTLDWSERLSNETEDKSDGSKNQTWNHD